jgi:hypothetical protein
MPAKTGVPSLQNVAKELCRLVLKFEPILVVVYATNPALLTALAAAGAACRELEKELAKVREYGD